ncbi:probable ATP-dependent RNA helicase DDX20 [Ostrea edulis]|uniref:probable ATP-dependent RNA helicase DDX20 n=1 Tax=Ostrea edulis TaxID=37623 RepID=UPI0024AF07BB|nr:probable ATP-dependent RNA helicase DDX20 [Ostrea edulis]
MLKASVAHDIQGGSRTGDVLINENVDFSGLLLSDNVLSGLRIAGFQRPSPIQLKAIPLGRCGLDLIVQAKSGTGKTCVFSVIALEGLQTKSYALQVLVLAPTREIAIQIWDVISSIGQCIPALKCYTFIGGMPVTEDKQKLKKCHIAVGTPGRIKQLIECGIMSTDSIRMFVLDEADKLLEESFQEQINWIYSTLPENKQMLALSATYPEYLAQHLTSYMRNPTFLRLNISDPALLGIKQFKRVVNYHALPNKVFDNKTKVVIELLSSVNFQQCLIFSNLQTRAQNMADALISHGWPTACIAGSHDQKDRNEAMSQLKTYKCRVLISTDLTSRGIDADKVNMVINLDVPKDHETYLHRIGRAGRFGTFGAAVTIVSQGQEENELHKVEKKCNTHIRDLPDPIPSTLAKSEGTINLDDMVSTEQIITDHTRLLPRKMEVTGQINTDRTRLSPRKTEVTEQIHTDRSRLSPRKTEVTEQIHTDRSRLSPRKTEVTEQIHTDRSRLSPRKTEVTEQIHTDRSRLSPRKTEVTEEQHFTSKGDDKPQFRSSKHSKNGTERERLKNPKSNFKVKGKRDIKKKASVSPDSDNEVRAESAVEFKNVSLNNVLSGRNSASANERGDFHNVSVELNSDHLSGRTSQTGDSPGTPIESSAEVKAKVERLTEPSENEEGAKERFQTHQKRDRGSHYGFPMNVPQLRDVLCRNTRKHQKTYEEKETAYKKYLEERDTPFERREIQVRPNPYVWKDKQKERLLSMIEKVLTIDEDGEKLGAGEKIKRTDTASTGSQTQGIDFPLNVKNEFMLKTIGEKIKRTDTASAGSQTQGIDFPIKVKDEFLLKTIGEKIKRTDTASAGSQTQGIDFPVNVKDEFILKTIGKSQERETCGSQYMYKCNDDDKSAILPVAPSESVLLQREKEFEHSEYHGVTYNNEGVEKHDYSDEEGELSSEEEECFEDEENDYDNEWCGESEVANDKEPQFCQSDYPDRYDSGNPYHWPPVYSPYFYNPYYYAPNALQPRMTHEQKKFMFNYHLTSAHHQQHSYISAMLSKFY